MRVLFARLCVFASTRVCVCVGGWYWYGICVQLVKFYIFPCDLFPSLYSWLSNFMGEKLLALQNFWGDTDSVYLLKIYEGPATPPSLPCLVAARLSLRHHTDSPILGQSQSHPLLSPLALHNPSDLRVTMSVVPFLLWSSRHPMALQRSVFRCKSKIGR